MIIRVVSIRRVWSTNCCEEKSKIQDYYTICIKICILTQKTEQPKNAEIPCDAKDHSVFEKATQLLYGFSWHLKAKDRRESPPGLAFVQHG